MRAWKNHDLGSYDKVMQLESLGEMPAPGNDDVHIDVHGCGLNFPDLLLSAGEYQEKPELPFTLGQEVMGTVAAVGSGVTTIQAGQRVVALPVIGFGGLTERTVAKANDVFPIPDWLDDVAAAALPLVYQTAHVALHRRAGLRPGETLLVQGAAGGVGSATIQVGKAAGARVVAVAGGSKKAQICRELGADVVIDHHEEDFVSVVKEITDGRGVDVVFDPVGGEVFTRSGRVMAFEGRHLIIGFASGEIPRPALGYPLVKNYSLVGVHWGLYRKRAPQVVHETHEELMRLAKRGDIAPLVHTTVDFENAPEGLRMIAEREAIGKVVVKVR